MARAGAAAKRTRTDGTQRGYALLTVMFLAATMLLIAMAAVLNVGTEGRREKEDELEWRGNQYVRAIRLYYRKNGRFPQTIEDLTKHDIGQPRFIRKAYTDPMNKQDGSWRFIYVTPSGQLIGSVMHTSLGQGGGAGVIPGLFGGQGQGQGNTAGGAPSSGTSTGMGASPSPGSPSSMSTGLGTTSPASATAAPGASSIASATNGSTDPLTGDQNGITGPVLGGNLIGVASKIKKPSLRVYEQGTTYFQWEFIWDPTKTQGAGAAPASMQTPGTPGQPAGQPSPTGPPQNQNGPPNQNSQPPTIQQSQIQQ